MTMKRTVAHTLSVAIVVALLVSNHTVKAAEPTSNDITPRFANAGLTVEGFRAVEVGGIVILRGRAVDHAVAEQAGAFAQSLGYTRVANLIQITEPIDDIAIERLAERRLGIRSLDGCQLHVDSDKGVVHISGKVQNELQKDVAIAIVRNIDGVRSVLAEMQKQ